METKMRIKLYDPKGESLLSDRLVEQKTEFTTGPKSTHKGPFTVEANLRNQEDIDSLIEYLKKVKGDLPIGDKKTPATKKTKTIQTMLSEKEPLKDLLNTVLQKCKTQEKIFEYLREYGFTFLTSDILEHVNKDLFELQEKHDKYQFLVRLVKEAKDPANDQFDYRLAIGMKILGKKRDKIVIYLWGKYKTFKNIPWENKEDINFKKVVKILQFPDFLNYDERKKWRAEHRKYENNIAKNPDYQPSKWYLRWKPYVKGL